MSSDPLGNVGTLQTPQTDRADDRQVVNSAGGYTFQVSDEQRLLRFLILGTMGGTYYKSERELTVETTDAVLRIMRSMGPAFVELVREVSVSGRAFRQQPTLWCLAAAACAVLPDHSPDSVLRAAAYRALPDICRTGTHLFTFMGYTRNFPGGGRGLRRAVGRWYTERDPQSLARQVAKYAQRDGWSHRDVLRLAHPKPPTEAHEAIFRFVTGKGGATSGLIVNAEATKATSDPVEAARLITAYRLEREMVNPALLSHPAVAEALLPNLGLTAVIRNLASMTASGFLSPGSDALRIVLGRLADTDAVHKARIHPMQALFALKTYQSGQGMRGSLTWNPIPQLVDALDELFYTSFANVEPTGKRTVLALDVSGSMTFDKLAGTNITPREASAAMAMVIARTEPDYAIMGFCDRFVGLNISPRQRLDDVVRAISNLPFGSTDCALPMIWAREMGAKVDTFVVYTDNETWAGREHPHQALRTYRNQTGIAARLAVCGMTSTDFTIADPSDPGMLDCVGFDAATPQVIAEFSKGTV